MEKHRDNICCLCLRPSIEFYASDDCLKPPMHARFDGATELQRTLENILKNNERPEKSTNVCDRCNSEFKQIYTFMDHCWKNLLSPTNAEQNNTLTTMTIDEESPENIFKGSHLTNIETIKKAVVRLKRLKIMSFGIQIKTEPDDTSTDDGFVVNSCEANLEDPIMEICPQIPEVKCEILDDMSTENYQAIEISNQLEQNILTTGDSLGDFITSQAIGDMIGFDQYSKELSNGKNFKRLHNHWTHNRKTALNKRYQCSQCGKCLANFFSLRRHQNTHSARMFECNKCSVSFRTKLNLHLHKNKKHGSSIKVYKCDECDRYLASSFSLKRHRAIHDGITYDQQNDSEKHFKCDHCEKYFISLRILKKHQKLHAEKVYNCDKCNSNFPTRRSLQWHRYKEHSGLKKRYKCEQCEKSLSNLFSLKRHQEIHAGNVFECDQCNANFRTQHSLKKHKRNVHNSRAACELKGRFECDQCGKYLTSITGLRYHQQLHTGNVLDCSECGATFRSSRHLRLHKQKMHGGFSQQFNCDQCEKSFNDSVCLRRHQELHAGNILECDQCDAKFSTESYLQVHKRKRHGNVKKRFKCDQCERDFSVLASLKRHRLLHKNLTFPCDLCDAEFRQQGTLLLHKRLHTGEIFKCVQCDRSFARRSLFRKHIAKCVLSQTDDVTGTNSTLKKHFACNQCKKLFSGTSSLNRHLLLHQNPSFPCDFCDATFRQKGGLLIHRRIHTGETFDCKQCNRNFTRHNRFREHLEKCKQKSQEASLESQKTVIVPYESVNSSAIANDSFQKANDAVTVSCSELLKSTKSENDSNEEWLQDDTNDAKITTEETTSSLPHLNDDIRKETDSQHSSLKRRYKCNQCEKDFASTSSLNRHRLLHQNVFFPCDLCDAKFTQKSTRVVHMRLHTGETFDCSRCDKSFTRKADLPMHYKIHKLEDSLMRQETTVEPDQSIGGFEATCSSFQKENNDVAISSNESLKSVKSENDLNEERVHDDINAKEIEESSLEESLKGDQLKSAPDELSADDPKSNLSRVNGIISPQPIDLKRCFQCDVCEKCFSNSFSLRRHSLLHRNLSHEENPLQPIGSKRRLRCDVCQKYFSNSFSLKRHSSLHQNVMFPCDFCTAKFRQKDSMLVHRRIHTSETFNCDKCGRGFTRKSFLQEHIEDCNSGSKKRFKCDQCEKEFSTLYTLKDHQGIHAGNVIECDQCHANFNTMRTLRWHKCKMHNDSKKRHNCDQCKKDFCSNFALKNHKTNLHTENTFDCDQCHNVFRTKQLLQLHKQKTHENQPGESKERFKCDKCDKDFCSAYILKDHQSLHDGRTFDCDQCNGRFGTKRMLRWHKYKHHSSHSRKKYKCDQCEKYLASSASLKRHQEIHIGNNFICNVCAVTFNTRQNLQLHQRKMHSDSSKPFKCGQCRKDFTDLTSLRRHQKIHAEVQAGNIFECYQCNAIFLDKGDFDLHKRSHMNVIVDKLVTAINELSAEETENSLSHLNNVSNKNETMAISIDDVKVEIEEVKDVRHSASECPK